MCIDTSEKYTATLGKSSRVRTRTISLLATIENTAVQPQRLKTASKLTIATICINELRSNREASLILWQNRLRVRRLFALTKRSVRVSGLRVSLEVNRTEHLAGSSHHRSLQVSPVYAVGIQGSRETREPGPELQSRWRRPKVRRAYW